MKKLLFLTVLLATMLITGCREQEDSLSRDEQLAIDLAKIDNFLSENNIDTEEHQSGIRYVVNSEGTGANAMLRDDIALRFEGFFLGGQSIGRDTIGFTLNLGDRIIEAWRLMIPEIKEGGSMTIYAPSVYCFGNIGNGSIPPNTNLVYSIEVIKVINGEAEQKAADELIIDEFLEESNIEAEVDPSGIRFVTLTEGTGDSPSESSEVVVKYEGTTLAGNVFDSNDLGVQFGLENLIDAWQIMIPTMKEGGKIKIYAPSQFCYGPDGNQTIPPNTILVFEIELLEVK